MTLPAWAQSPEAQALLQAIVAEKPQARWLQRYEGRSPCAYPRYGGTNAKALRALWEQMRDEAPDPATFRELSRVWPDDLVLQLLREADEGLTVCVGDPVPEAMRRVA